MTDAEVGSEGAAPSKPRSPARPRVKKVAAGAASPSAAPPSASASARPRPPAAKKASRRAATGPGLSDWLSLGLLTVLVAAAAALYQWRGEAQLGSPPPAYSQPVPSNR